MSNMTTIARAAYNRPDQNMSLKRVRKPVASVMADDTLSTIVQVATLARRATTDAAYQLRIKHIKSLVKEL